MTFETRTSTPNWVQIDYDDSRWFPMPLSLKGTRWADVAEWAFDSACDRFLRAGRELTKKVVRKEVLPFAQTLVQAHVNAVGKIGAHKFFFHCPDYTHFPVLTSIAVWKRDGTREEALQHYAYWGTKSATTEPSAEWFETGALGVGVRAQWAGVIGPGPYDQVNYAFRDDAYDTDVHVFMTAWDHQRYTEVVPDLDRLVHGIRCVPGSSS